MGVGTNTVIVSGTIAYPPTVRGKGDKTVVNFAVPVKEEWIDKSTGTLNTHTEIMRCVVFDRNAQIAATRLQQGMSVVCHGKNRTTKFVKDGVEQQRTKVVCGQIQIVDGTSAFPTTILEQSDTTETPEIERPVTEPLKGVSQAFNLIKALKTLLKIS